jgi:hypothetical protein
VDTFYNPQMPDSLSGHEGHAWQRAKLALLRDWDQTKYDLGGGDSDLHQGLVTTLAEIVGSKPVPPRGVPVSI